MNTKVSKQGNTEYESEGTKYYKRAFFAQAAIGIGSLVQAVAVVVIAIALSGCAGMMPKSTPSVSRTPVVTGARIDADAIIKSADEADCEMALLMYSEGKKASKLMIQCNVTGIPVPNRKQTF